MVVWQDGRSDEGNTIFEWKKTPGRRMSVNCESTIRATDLASVTRERGGKKACRKKKHQKRVHA
jgi:hypothetical protein